MRRFLTLLQVLSLSLSLSETLAAPAAQRTDAPIITRVLEKRKDDVWVLLLIESDARLATDSVGKEFHRIVNIGAVTTQTTVLTTAVPTTCVIASFHRIYAETSWRWIGILVAHSVFVEFTSRASFSSCPLPTEPSQARHWQSSTDNSEQLKGKWSLRPWFRPKSRNWKLQSCVRPFSTLYIAAACWWTPRVQTQTAMWVIVSL